MPLAGFAHAENLFPHGIEERPKPLDDSFVPTHDKNQGCILGPDLGARDRRIHVVNPACPHSFGKLPGRARGNGAGINDHHALVQRWFDTIGSKQHLFHGLGI